MDQQGPLPPLPSSSTTHNPVVAVGRKLKSVLGSHQRPSVRILRESSSTKRSQRVPSSKGNVEKSTAYQSSHGQVQRPGERAESVQQSAAPRKDSTFGNRMRSMFRRDDESNEDESFEREYDPDTVDLLDVMGKYYQDNIEVYRLTPHRPRSLYTLHPHECSKFTFRTSARKNYQSPTHISNNREPRRDSHNGQAQKLVEESIKLE